MGDKPSVAVVGVGGVGGYLALQLSLAGLSPLLCVRTPFDHLEVTSGGTTHEVAADFATDPAAVAPVDWVLLATKAQDTAVAQGWLAALTGPDTRVVVCQNGIRHAERVAPYVGNATIVPALVYAGGEALAPGRILHHGGNRVIVPAGAAGAELRLLLAGSAAEVVQEADFRTVAWRKLLSNLAANPLTALTLRRIEVFHEPGIHALAEAVLTEGLAVARAEGATLGDATVGAILDSYALLADDAGSSMLYDRLAGRRTECEAITGVVVEAAAAQGVPVPVNTALLALLRAVDGNPLPLRAE